MSNDQWEKINSLKGWTVTDDYGLIESAHLKRHPRHWNYMPITETTPKFDVDVESYDKLNRQLHDELRRVSKEHFANTPVPAELQQDREPYFTHFTYQNYDWYGPTYECFIVVIGDYINAELIQKLQSLLVSDYHDWCIQVAVAEDNSFGSDDEFAIFSDQIIMHIVIADALNVPRD